MKLSPHRLMIAGMLVTLLVLCAGVAFVGGNASVRTSNANPQGNTTTTRTNNTDGSTTVTTTTTYKDGSTTTTTTYDKDGHDAGTTRVDTQTKDGETTTTTTTYDGNGHETGRTIERVDQDGNKTIIVIDPATGGVKSSTTVPADKPKTPPDLPPYKPKWAWKIEPKYNWSPIISAGYKVETRTSPGLNSQVITTPNGILIVNEPELYATDTFTGTVQTEPSGKSEAERAQNQAQLNGIVLVIGGQKTSGAEKMFTRTMPANPSREAQSLTVMVKGETVVNAPIPLSDAAPPPPLENVQLPTGGQMGRNFLVHALSNGVVDPTDYVKVGGQELPLIAESPRMRVVKNTSNAAGPTEIEFSEQGDVTKGPFQNIGVKVSAAKTNLLKREKEPLDVTCFGLKGIQQDVPLDVVTTGVVTMSGGNTQHFDIHPSDVRADGTYPRNFTITAQEAGTFSVTASVTLVNPGNPPPPPRRPVLFFTRNGRVIGRVVAPPGANDLRFFWLPGGMGGIWTRNGQPIPGSAFQVPQGTNDVHFSLTGRFVPGQQLVPPPAANDIEWDWEGNHITEAWWTRDGKRMDRIPLKAGSSVFQFDLPGVPGPKPRARNPLAAHPYPEGLGICPSGQCSAPTKDNNVPQQIWCLAATTCPRNCHCQLIRLSKTADDGDPWEKVPLIKDTVKAFYDSNYDYECVCVPD
jgi:hypothetical protein